ncbi:MAG: hypothetical protein IJZ96_05295 [Lachnospiraceae bacterium]|nr:hypothetical protein [Lachnospiraceae bacterium]
MDFRSTGLGCAMRLEYQLNHLRDRLATFQSNVEDLYKQLHQAQMTIDEGNTYDEEVRILATRLDEIDKELKGEDAA